MIQVVRPHLITMSDGGIGDDDKVDEHVDTHKEAYDGAFRIYDDKSPEQMQIEYDLEERGQLIADRRFAIITAVAGYACYVLINDVYVAVSTPFPGIMGDEGDVGILLKNCCCLVPLLVSGVLWIMESAPEGSKTYELETFLFQSGQPHSSRRPESSTGGTSPPGSIMKYSSWNQPFCHSCGRQVLSGMLRSCDACGKQRCINCGGSGNCRDCNRGWYR